jgi:hypothetical protein
MLIRKKVEGRRKKVKSLSAFIPSHFFLLPSNFSS